MAFVDKRDPIGGGEMPDLKVKRNSLEPGASDGIRKADRLGATELWMPDMLRCAV